MTPEQIENWLRQFENLPRDASEDTPRTGCVTPKRPVKLSAKDIAQMRHMRREGFVIDDIARAFKCSWETARRRTLGFSA